VTFSSFFFASLAMACCATAAGIDFTPSEIQTVEDGFPTTRVAFRDGSHTILFRPAKGWKGSGGGKEVQWRPSDSGNVLVRLGNSPVGPTTAFDAEGVRIYAAAARAALPRDAQNIEVLSDGTDAYPLDDWKSYEAWLSYDLFGKKSVCWILFITMNPQRQICFVLDGTKAEVDRHYPAARKMLGSWFEPPTGWLQMVQRTPLEQ
jgi:hypothetical protein